MPHLSGQLDFGTKACGKLHEASLYVRFSSLIVQFFVENCQKKKDGNRNM